MKLKYYLRGIGIGIIITTIILAISFSQREVEISDEQIMVRAAALGMIMPEDEQKKETEQMIDDTQTADSTMEGDVSTEMSATELLAEEESKTPVSDPEPESEKEMFRLIIQEGEACGIVCENLQENGVIADANELQKYLLECGYTKRIMSGEYDIPYGLSVEEVAKIIMKGPVG